MQPASPGHNNHICCMGLLFLSPFPPQDPYHKNTHIHPHENTLTYIHQRTHTHKHQRAHTHTYIHTHTHTHIYTTHAHCKQTGIHSLSPSLLVTHPNS